MILSAAFGEARDRKHIMCRHEVWLAPTWARRGLQKPGPLWGNTMDNQFGKMLTWMQEAYCKSISHENEQTE